VTDNQQTLQHAIQAIQYGDRASGKRLLAQLLQADPQNVQAWLWMSEKGARARLAQLEARATVHAAPQRRRTRRQIILAGGLALSLFCGLILLIYTLVAVMPRAQARAERLSESYPQTATLWCPSCAQADEPVLLKTSLGAGLFGGPVGELEHGTTVAILDYRWSSLERRYYTEVSADGQRGWVPETILRQ
jgi:hypothetical protein